jgi:error-prone DNA polymerase
MSWDNPPIPWQELERLLSWGSNKDGHSAEPDSASKDGASRDGAASKGAPSKDSASKDSVNRAGGGEGDHDTAAERSARRRAGSERRLRPVTRLPVASSPAGGSGAAGRPSGSKDPAWAELHCHSSYSFLDGASSPADLIGEAAARGLTALAITDHDGMYGVPQFAQAAARLKESSAPIETVFGAELSLDLPGEQGGVPDPAGRHLLVLARDPEGYRRLCWVISEAQLAGKEKGRPIYDEAALAAAHDGHWVILTGCRKGAVPAALAVGGPGAAARGLGAGWRDLEAGWAADGDLGAGRPAHQNLRTGQLASWGLGAGHPGIQDLRTRPSADRDLAWGAAAANARTAAAGELRSLLEMFGRQNVMVELTTHDQPADDERNDALFELARAAGVGVIATGNVHYAAPRHARLAQALAAVRARRSLAGMDGWLAASGTAYIRSGAEMAWRLRRYPGVIERTVALAADCAFDFQVIAPKLPDFPVPGGGSEAGLLRTLVAQKAPKRYGPPQAERAPGAYEQIARELEVIENLGFPGYFLIVHDIVKFCEDAGILCQGRGSAANSAVCYALGITSVDPIRHGLLFERFLSAGRDGPPDIDLDIEHRRREDVIQYVYRTYGRDKAAQVANVISYRPRMALRDAGRALGYLPEQQNAWSRQVGPRGFGPGQPVPADADVPEAVVELAAQMQRLPRHLGIHSGGMVICDRPVGEVCPVEWARMPGRTVLQWDKDDCAYAGLVKFDLLGLGMLSALRDCFELVAAHHGRRWDLHSIPQEDAGVYAMLQEADTVGVFQVESRAQMATLPRLRPQKFYDLVIEVALIRPGPIQGGSVHPYMRRRHGDEVADLPHETMRQALDKTLGVPLFQEQMMQIAIDCAGFSATEADKLRQAMSSKRAPERIEELRARLLDGMAARDIPPDVAEDIYFKILAFSSYGFPESHAISFAYLVYASAWLKCYYPAAFTAALLRNQPMGFYAPASLISDARRHGVQVRGVDVNASDVLARLENPQNPTISPQNANHPAEAGPEAGQVPDGEAAEAGPEAGQVPDREPADAAPGTNQVPDGEPAEGKPVPGQPAIRLGLSDVRNLGADAAAAVVSGQPYRNLEDFARRTKLPAPALEALATAGAFGCFGVSRREALWAAGAAATIRAGQLPGTTPGLAAPRLPAMTPAEETFADLWATGTYGTHPVEHIRPLLTDRGVIGAEALKTARPGAGVAVAGLVTHRQQPGTARGVVFLSLEDETGMANVICPRQVWERHRKLAMEANALVVYGRVERLDGAVSLLATSLRRLRVVAAARSRDFRLPLAAPLRADGQPGRLPARQPPPVQHPLDGPGQGGQEHREHRQRDAHGDDHPVFGLARGQRRRLHLTGAVQPHRYRAARSGPGGRRDPAAALTSVQGPARWGPDDPGVRAVIGHHRPGRGRQQDRGNPVPGQLSMRCGRSVRPDPDRHAVRQERTQDQESGGHGGQQPRFDHV